MSEAVETIVPLNRSEHGYAAIDGLAATMIQPYMLRFNAPVSEPDMRQALRRLVSCYPKLRAVLEPGLHRYHLRILPDDELVDQLFEVAYRVQPGVDIDDQSALEAYHNQMLNEVMPLERGLSARWRFMPHASRPVLFFGVHHLLSDGRSILLMIADLMKLLNGQGIEVQPVEAPSMVGSIAPAHWWQWPVQIMRSRRHKLDEARRLSTMTVQQVPTRTTAHFTANKMRYHVVPVGTAEMRVAARKLGVSLNTFVVSALAQLFLDQAPQDPTAAAVIRISVDLRRYYPEHCQYGPLLGNHVGAFLVTEQGVAKSASERVKSVDASIKQGQERYARREMFWTYLLEEALPWMGRTLIAHVAGQLKRKNRFPRISCHATSLGDVSWVNPKDAHLKIVEFVPAVTSISLLHVLSEMDGKLYVTASWQRCDTTVAEIDDYLSRLDQVLLRLIQAADLTPT